MTTFHWAFIDLYVEPNSQLIAQPSLLTWRKQALNCLRCEKSICACAQEKEERQIDRESIRQRSLPELIGQELTKAPSKYHSCLSINISFPEWSKNATEQFVRGNNLRLMANHFSAVKTITRSPQMREQRWHVDLSADEFAPRLQLLVRIRRFSITMHGRGRQAKLAAKWSVFVEMFYWTCLGFWRLSSVEV